MMNKIYPVPNVGDDVYVKSSFYMSHGVDDFVGGLCKVTRVFKSMSGGSLVTFIEVDENPGVEYNWEFLYEMQDELKKQFGTNRGYQDPDNRPEFNQW